MPTGKEHGHIVNIPTILTVANEGPYPSITSSPLTRDAEIRDGEWIDIRADKFIVQPMRIEERNKISVDDKFELIRDHEILIFRDKNGGVIHYSVIIPPELNVDPRCLDGLQPDELKNLEAILQRHLPHCHISPDTGLKLITPKRKEKPMFSLPGLKDGEDPSEVETDYHWRDLPFSKQAHLGGKPPYFWKFACDVRINTSCGPRSFTLHGGVELENANFGMIHESIVESLEQDKIHVNIRSIVNPYFGLR